MVCPSSVFETASSAKQGRPRARLVEMTLRGLSLVLQAALGDGLAFDPFSLQQAPDLEEPHPAGELLTKAEYLMRRPQLGGSVQSFSHI
jgi:hypothetical protein